MALEKKSREFEIQYHPCKSYHLPSNLVVFYVLVSLLRVSEYAFFQYHFRLIVPNDLIRHRPDKNEILCIETKTKKQTAITCCSTACAA